MKTLNYIGLAAAALLSACDGSVTTTNTTVAVTKEAKGAAVTLKSIEVSRDVGSNGMIPTAPAGVTYVVAKDSLKNTGQEALTFDRWPQPELVDPAGHRLERELMNSTMLSAMANPSWAETLNPNLTTDAVALWKIDEKSFDRKTWTLQFKSSPPISFPLQ